MSVDSAGAGGRPIWLTVFLGIAILVALLNAGVYLYGLMLPDEWHVETSIVVAAKPDEVYPLISTPKRWAEWAAWNKERDGTLEYSFAGPESGKDSSFAWQGQQLGSGQLTIVEAEPSAAVRYNLELGGAAFSDEGEIRLEPADGGTRVTWTDGGELGGTLGRLFGKRLESSVEADFAASLENLKRLAEPRADGA